MADSQRKTANLFDESTIQQGYYGTQAINYSVFTADNKYRSFTKNLKAGTYTLNINADETMYILRCNNDIDGSINVYSNPPYTFTLSADTTIYVSWRNTNTTNSFTNMTVMLNEGETALPYEPYGWVHSLRKLTTSTDTITTLPADVYADGTNATVGLVGNMSQTGTPTPSSPIQPSECGDKTANLYFKKLAGANISDTGLVAALAGFDLYIAEVEQGVRYSGTGYVYAFFEDIPTIGSISYDSGRSVNSFMNIVSPINGFVAVRNSSDVQNAMCNTGSTLLPYEPYGIKIPILSANTTTPVYLGSVQSTRRIKKYEMTGSEDITYQSAYSRFYFTRTDAYYSGTVRTTPCICSHYQSIHDGRAIDDIPNESIYVATADNKTAFNIKTTDFTDVTDFKAYLAAQYAAGTPVTVWYVLADSTTGIVNEPIRKIGDYADTVSGITIPTITGKDSFDVLTTLKPSEVSLAYTGWHDASVKEWDGSEWQ